MKLSRDKLKQIIKEELEEMVAEEGVLEEQDFQQYLAAVKQATAKGAQLSEADNDPKSPEAQSKLKNVMSKIGKAGLDVIKGGLAVGVDMAVMMAAVGMAKGLSPQEVADAIPIIGVALGAGGAMGAVAGGLGVKPSNMGFVSSTAGAVRDTIKGK